MMMLDEKARSSTMLSGALTVVGPGCAGTWDHVIFGSCTAVGRSYGSGTYGLARDDVAEVSLLGGCTTL
jgi:hypothetical protein